MEVEKIGRWIGRTQWNSELGSGVVLLVVELCRIYRCEMEKVEKGTALDAVTSYNVHSAPKIPGFRPIRDLRL